MWHALSLFTRQSNPLAFALLKNNTCPQKISLFRGLLEAFDWNQPETLSPRRILRRIVFVEKRRTIPQGTSRYCSTGRAITVFSVIRLAEVFGAFGYRRNAFRAKVTRSLTTRKGCVCPKPHPLFRWSRGMDSASTRQDVCEGRRPSAHSQEYKAGRPSGFNPGTPLGPRDKRLSSKRDAT